MTSIFRRKGRKGWTLKFQTADGLWRFEQKPTRQACEDRALELRASPDSGRSVLFRDYAARWLERAGQHVRDGTHRVYTSLMTAHLIPALGHLPIREVTRARVKDLLAEKLAAKLGRSYVLTNMRGALHACLEDAREDGIININPASRLRGKSASGAKTKVPPKAMDADQLRRFLDACRRTEPRYWMLFRLMSLTGLRPGEALALHWGAVDLEAKALHVRQGYTRGKLQLTKSGRERTVDLAATLAEELKTYHAAQQQEALAAGRQATWLFPSPRYPQRPVEHGHPDKAFKRAVKAAGLPQHFTPHGMRHTFASLLLSRGHPIQYVRTQLGHATIQMTVDTYGSWLPSGNQAIVDDLAEVTTEVTGTTEQAARGARKHPRFGAKRTR